VSKRHRWVLEYSGSPTLDFFSSNEDAAWMRVWVCVDCYTRHSAVYPAAGLPIIAPQDVTFCSGKNGVAGPTI